MSTRDIIQAQKYCGTGGRGGRLEKFFYIVLTGGRSDMPPKTNTILTRYNNTKAMNTEQITQRTLQIILLATLIASIVVIIQGALHQVVSAGASLIMLLTISIKKEDLI